MKIDIIAKKEGKHGSMTRYSYYISRYVQGAKVVVIDDETPFHLPLSMKGYVYNPLRVMMSIGGDVVHLTEPYLGHLLYFINAKNLVITCHDIYHTVVKDYRGLNKILYDFSISGMKKARKIIADSEFTKQELIKYLRIPENKIEVIQLGVDLEIYKKIKKPILKSTKSILHIGFAYERKNILGLIKAIYKLSKKIPEIQFTQVGADPSMYFDYIQKLGLEKNISFLGQIPENQLVELYNSADLFVFPSFYEGFGLPPLEAMACGCPVITSNTTSLPEVVGDAGVMVDPYDIDGLAEAMYSVLTNDGLRQDLINKGLKRAEMFTWERTAKETYRVYEEVGSEYKFKMKI